MSKRDHEREVSRRALIKWSLAAGAALGVSRARILEVLEGTAGKRTALAAAAMPNKRSVHIRAGTGGLAWFTLMWPHNDIAAGNKANAALAGRGQFSLAPNTDKPLTIGPNTAFRTLPGAQQITAFVAGTNETHTPTPLSINKSVNSGSLFAITSVLQSDNPAVVPVITVGDLDFGSTPGAPLPSKVETADGIVGLFNSAASQSHQLLSTSTHADLYRAQYATLAALNRASNLSTTRVPYHTARNAASFLGKNLADKLSFRPGVDDVAYGMTAAEYTAISNDPATSNRKDKVTAFGRTLAATAKAFELGLTSSVIMPGINDDPHGAFGSGGTLTADAQNVITTVKRMLDAFMADLGARHDPVSGEVLANDLVMTIEGDTPKTPIDFSGWQDPTPGDANWMYVLGGGKLRTGWFGGMDRNGNVAGFDPATGGTATANPNLQAQVAVAAVAYAISRGNLARVQEFARAEISGVVVPV
jgi:hypothetical protein